MAFTTAFLKYFDSIISFNQIFFFKLRKHQKLNLKAIKTTYFIKTIREFVSRNMTENWNVTIRQFKFNYNYNYNLP